MTNTLRTQKGVALLEVLITVLIVSIGLLGLAGLQTLSIKNNQSAYLRTQATYLAYDIIDKMRANIESARAGNYATALDTAPTGASNCDTSTCTSANAAEFDLNSWKCSLGKWNGNSVCTTTLNLAGYLPNGDGQITQNGNIHTISITWLDRDNQSTTFEVSTAL